MVINTNILAQTSAANLNNSQSMLAKSLARLSSGSKITSPADDAAGLAVSMRFSAQINRTSAANANIGNAVSFTQTQDGFLSKIGDALNRMSELSISAQDATKSDSDRGLYDKEFQTLAAYITNASGKDFNGVSLFSAASLSITTDGDGGTFTMTGIDVSGNASYTTATGSNVGTTTAATAALTAVKAAITQLATDRASLGANETRLSYTSDQLTTLQNNLTAANSQILDVDVATESTQYAKYQILVQAGTSMLAQANANPQSVLKLLQ
jgi:flagellin